MKLISHPIFLKHDRQGHPECAERLKKALRTFKYEKAPKGENYIQLVHTRDYVDKIKQSSKRAGKSAVFVDMGDTYVNSHTYEAACYAVGASIQAADYAKKKKNAFALVRPPGHHAHPGWTNGFCIFNNMAIAAAHLAGNKSRVLIIDIDMHRGDGTGDCVGQLNEELDDRIYYFSINQRGVFPGVSIDEGNIMNLYIDQNTSEADYILILQEEIPKLIKQFKPTVIGISAGFDSLARDKVTFNDRLGCGLNNTAKMIKALRTIIKGTPFFAILEGGYDPDSVVEGVAAFTDTKVKLPELKAAKDEKKENNIVIQKVKLPKEKPVKKEKPPKIKKMKVFREHRKRKKKTTKKKTKPATKKKTAKKKVKKKVKKKTVKKKSKRK